MDISTIRNEFVIFVVDDEESICEILRESLSGAGYQVETFPDAEKALARVKESPPHLIFSDIRMPGMNGIQLLEEVKKLSTDIEYIIMTSHASLDTAVTAMKLGAYDYIYKPFEALSEVVSTADRTIERVYMKFENEQLLDELAKKNSQLSSVNQQISQENEEISAINTFMHKLTKHQEPDGVVQLYLDSLSSISNNKPVIYFKYLSAYSSLVAVQASKISVEQIKNLGINLSEVDPKIVPELLKTPEKVPGLPQMLKEVFQLNEFSALPFIQQEVAVGAVVVFEKLESEGARRLRDSFSQITQVSYDNAMMQVRIKEMAIKDPLTGLYNRRFFNEKLEEEMNRSRRTHYPLSLIYLDIDHFKKYNDTNGHPMGDVIIKSVAQILHKTSRKTDIVARLGGEEFGIICPHTPCEGGAIKAEKIRLTVENTKFPHGEKQPLGKLTVSLGVSEFPSMVSESAALVRTADDALYKVKQGGRNKVCMAEPAEGFKPEFEPLPVPAKPGGKGSAA